MGGTHGTKVAILQERVRSLEASLAKSEALNKPLVDDNAAYQKTVEALDTELAAVRMEKGILAQRVKDLQKVVDAPLREVDARIAQKDAEIMLLNQKLSAFDEGFHSAQAHVECLIEEKGVLLQKVQTLERELSAHQAEVLDK